MPQLSSLTTHRARRWTVGALIIACVAPPLPGQGVLGRIKQKATDAVNQTADDAANAATDAAVHCVATNTACIAKAQQSGKPVVVTDAKGHPVSSDDSAQAVAAASGGTSTQTDAGTVTAAPAPSGPAESGASVFVNYDFVPGDRVLFAEDFSTDAVGDFPKRIELKQGNMDVVEYQGQHFLRTTGAGEVAIALPEMLPDRFTFEADYAGGKGWSAEMRSSDEDNVSHLQFSPIDGGISGTVNSSMSLPEGAERPVAHIALMVDGHYAKAYVNGVRVANVPNANFARSKTITLGLPGSTDDATYITNIRIAEGGKKLYDALAASGRVATHGILFATGSDAIRPESKPTLDQIGDMLKQHATLRLLIEGHTDNVGNPASNQALSEKRAAAVKQYLIAHYATDGARLTTKGLGSSQPAAPNTTPEGRQTNRRVELVKQ